MHFRVIGSLMMYAISASERPLIGSMRVECAMYMFCAYRAIASTNQSVWSLHFLALSAGIYPEI